MPLHQEGTKGRKWSPDWGLCHLVLWGVPWVAASAEAGSGQEGGHPGHSGLLTSCRPLEGAALGLSRARGTLHHPSGPVCFFCDEGGCSTPAQRTPFPGPP